MIYTYFFIVQTKITTCTENQFWKVHANATILCEDCENCPPGQGLSHECGKRISSKTTVTCLPCQPGISSSSKHDTSSCTPCFRSIFQLQWNLYLSVFVCLSLQASNPCTASHFLVEDANGTTSCIDCLNCPPGQGLSHECGSKISSNATVTCVPCPESISFSTKYDMSSCTPCSAPCSEDQVVLQNCTPTMNVKCDKKCYSKDR